MSEASAPGKLILCGEHAVVYGRPAIALPLREVRAHVTVQESEPGSGILIDAPDINQRWLLSEAPEHPFSLLIGEVCEQFALLEVPDLQICIRSDIPIAGGMGSGAAVATALVRAVARHLGHELPASQISSLVYASERRLHGTPSGIDNTVVAFEQPIWFVRQRNDDAQKTTPTRLTATAPTIEPIRIAIEVQLLIGDTGVRSETRLPVGDLRRRWQADPLRYEALFDEVGELVAKARAVLLHGDRTILGELLNENHRLLRLLGVSSPELDRLVDVAKQAGAQGAKLSGAGWGGVMVALVAPEQRARVRAALLGAGAVAVLETSMVY